MVDWLRLFQTAATEIRREAQPLFGSAKAKERQGKGAGGDVTRFVDSLAESIVLKTIDDNNVPCVLVSEEGGTQEIHGGGDDYVVLDGIDGTTNALHRIPFSATSIAHATGPMLEDVDVGFIMDLNSGTVYKAQKGKGAYEDDKPLSPSEVHQLREAVVAVELTYPRDFHRLIQRLIPIMAHTSKFRQLGSTALETVYVASGALDAFIDLRGLTRAVDLAAASIIIWEAGAFIAGPNGQDLNMELRADERTQFVAAGSRQLLQEIMSLVQ